MSKKKLEWIQISPGIRVREDQYLAMQQSKRDREKSLKKVAAETRRRKAMMSGGEINPRTRRRDSN